jgi:hypothetical protein
MLQLLAHTRLPRIGATCVGSLLFLFVDTTAAQSPSASASLWQEFTLQSSSSPSLWVCEGFAASSEPWLTAGAILELRLDGHPIAAQGFMANYWGATYQVSEWVQPSVHDRTISCDIYVSDLNGSTSASDSAHIPGQPGPYVVINSDTGTVSTTDAQGRTIHRRDIWWQILNSVQDQTAWTHGGNITESFSNPWNPCGIPLVQAGAPKPVNGAGQFSDTYWTSWQMCSQGCGAAMTQKYALSSYGNQTVRSNHVEWWCGSIFVIEQ